MMLRVYADESGTNDIRGQQPGSAVPTLCGYIETAQYWRQFCRKWKKVLNDYRAPYFHFREFASRHLYSQESSPHYGWSPKKRDEFLYDLAFLSSEHAVPVGGFYNAKRHCELALQGNPFENCITQFFEDVRVALNTHWPNYNGKVLFVFDYCDDRSWVAPLRTVHEAFSKSDARFDGGIAFEDDRDPLHLPLQAADLYAYASRQYAERQMTRPDSVEPMRVLDFILNKNLYVSRKLAISSVAWSVTVKLIRKDQKKRMAEWAKLGMSKKVYYPEQHFPFEKYVK